MGIPVVPISAAKNEGIDELVNPCAIHVAKYQEAPLRQDFCIDENDEGGAVHRCLHAIMHLIEPCTKKSGYSITFCS